MLISGKLGPAVAATLVCAQAGSVEFDAIHQAIILERLEAVKPQSCKAPRRISASHANPHLLKAYQKIRERAPHSSGGRETSSTSPTTIESD